MSLNTKSDRFTPNVYEEVAIALGTTLKQMIPRLCHKYGMDRNTIVLAVTRAALDVSVFLEADHVGLTNVDALALAARVYEVKRDTIDDMLGISNSTDD